MAPTFAFDRVEVTSGGARRLGPFTAAVPADGVTVVAGPSGAGKSTLLRLCNRLEVATAGSVSFRGAPVHEIDPLVLRRRVGMVFQRPALFPGTVEDNLRVADPSGGPASFGEALEGAGLSRSFLGRVADELSGGEAQRACLARTLVTRPEALLMDEPTSSLDPSATRVLERLALDLAADGVPVVWVTHDLDQAARVGERLLVLVDGRLADDGETAGYLASGDDPHRP